MTTPCHGRPFGGGFRADRRGSVAVIFALSAAMLIIALGAGVDLMRGYLDQQKLSEVAALACQYATRPSVVMTGSANFAGAGSAATFDANVTSFVTAALHKQFSANAPSYGVLPVLTGNPGGSFTISLTSTVATTLMRIAGYTTMNIAATSNCFTAAAVPQVNNNGVLLQEQFNSTSVAGQPTVYIKPNGSVGTYGNPGPLPVQATFPSSPSFTGDSGAQWYVMGYCLESDAKGQLYSSVPGGGSNTVELDCENGSHSGGNSSISTQIYLEVGNFELRYFYASRVGYPNYDPVNICGSSAADVSWANDLQTGPYAGGTSVYVGTPVGASSLRTNQINVYLDPPLASGKPPTHTTLTDAETLAGSNLIDVCVYAPANGYGGNAPAVWVQRSVRVTVSSAGFYWLSFAADGANDSFGGALADILFCQGTCPGTVQDNFPSPSYNPYYPGGSSNTVTSTLLPDWLNPNGMNMGLFTDSFESPGYTSNATGRLASRSGNLNASKGTSGTTSGGWPAETPVPWYTTPINQVSIVLTGAEQGSQYPELAGDTGSSSNRLTGRPLLLMPGFYTLSYYYESDFIFNAVLTTTYCGATPAAANLNVSYGSGNGHIRSESATMAEPYAMNAVGAFIANGQIVSTPDSGGVSVFGTSSYTNPDTALSDTPPVTTHSTTASVPPDAISLTNYTLSTTSALMDICAYAPSWVARSATFKVQKTGYYWLIFSGQIAGSQSSGTGGAIDNVVVSALGSPAMTSAPSSPILVPVGSPQPSAAMAPSAGAGYTIVADPPTYPAPMQ